MIFGEREAVDLCVPLLPFTAESSSLFMNYDGSMEFDLDGAMARALTQVAPGTPLRDGLDRVLQSGRGGLIVFGDGPDVLNICSGGFLLDAAFTPQRLSELAKMDGAIILASDGSRIARANVHLVPNPNVPTAETGTRHRTSERVARSLNVPVIAVSESRKEIQAYVGDQRHSLEPVSRLLERSNQALQTLERYRNRLDQVTSTLAALEINNLVALKDVVEVLQRAEMTVRIASEIERNLLELGSDGRLVRLQLNELMSGVADDRHLLIRDYFQDDSTFRVEEAMTALSALDDDSLFNEEIMAKTLHLASAGTDLSASLNPRGLGLLTRVPRLAEPLMEQLVEQFCTLDVLLAATSEDLAVVEGMSGRRADELHTSIAAAASSAGRKSVGARRV